MVFSSLEFIFFFLPLVCAFYMLFKGIRAKNAVLIFASIVFYAFGEPRAVILMLMSIVFNYGLAMLIEKHRSIRSVFLAIAVALNLGLLFIFKYTGFFAESVNRLFSLSIDVPVIHLPIGISFFTFQAMSYVIDVYRGSTPAQKKISNILLYISFFPQLIAGPIVKYHDIEKQIDSREVSFSGYASGVKSFLFGLFKKVLIANNVGYVWSRITASDMGSMSLAAAWLGAVCFSLQIYFDFSAYSDMAIGLGRMFGFDFLENFNYPYISKSIREFWRRWHISLSTWFKEYLYIPLGGNRKGKIRTYINLFIVFFCTGLWHGASWNFVIWGMWHGLFSVLERLGLEKILQKDKTAVLSHIYTLFVVVTGFAIFGITDFSQLRQYLSVMFMNVNGILADSAFLFMLKNNIFYICAAVVLSTPVCRLIAKRESRALAILSPVLFLAGFVLSVAYLVSSGYNPFLYFRF